MGVEFTENIDRQTISRLIDEAVEKRDEARFTKLDDLSDRESEAWQQMRAEVLADIDSDDCRLSVASPDQIIEALDERGLTCLLVSVDLDTIEDFDDLTGVKMSISYSEQLAEAEMQSILSWLGVAMLRKSSE